MSRRPLLRLRTGEAAVLANLFGTDGSAYFSADRASELEHECERLAATELPVGTRAFLDNLSLRDHFNAVVYQYGHAAYLVGSALHKPDARDVDVVIEVPDREFEELFCPVHLWAHEGASGQWSEARERWSAECVAVAMDARNATGLEVDFKVFPESWARRKFRGLPIRMLTDAWAETLEPTEFVIDGFGSSWPKCELGDRCGLHVVRPGKAACDVAGCPDGASERPE